MRVFGITLLEEKPSTYVYYNNKIIVNNHLNADSTPTKKHSAISFNFTRWNVADGFCTVSWIPTGIVPVDINHSNLYNKLLDLVLVHCGAPHAEVNRTK